jgi:hypothetical protein
MTTEPWDTTNERTGEFRFMVAVVNAAGCSQCGAQAHEQCINEEGWVQGDAHQPRIDFHLHQLDQGIGVS